MSEPRPVLHSESGASWWPVLWGPALAVVGVVVDLAVGGGTHWGAWSVAATGWVVGSVVWVHARRRACSVSLTPAVLRQGREELPVDRIAEVEDVGAPVGARVLGGGWTPPRGATAVPLRLDDGSVVLAWSHDPAALRAAVARLLRRP
ncbi:hypothetical protein LX15_005457 [Streptoalloteichus tenebrarius]|uniref:DUF3093 domain-containing protein n=1 Tax=Streptoalloteichus tenebrarius (strain ATCC 17920 / DSM 40477 / JCM 4838 / CBS 697.72 / NBRC 16177 / NCIMB 11028 / NRRL B-12390 / A12253. 1 / ISP 5477) TaxID=1933 RepID=A0ABT1I1W8_STRSD|nr:hypothetical protein [Streptoalloteichus tenebrarius]MCP2261731.1 hypothetical protein [Streptoalloteichus tenebrarius]BFF02444.1 hypothetical protein GCM10020241_41190 [Streptoalloteichus tenebrarius]